MYVCVCERERETETEMCTQVFVPVSDTCTRMGALNVQLHVIIMLLVYHRNTCIT